MDKRSGPGQTDEFTEHGTSSAYVLHFQFSYGKQDLERNNPRPYVHQWSKNIYGKTFQDIEDIPVSYLLTSSHLALYQQIDRFFALPVSKRKLCKYFIKITLCDLQNKHIQTFDIYCTENDLDML